MKINDLTFWFAVILLALIVGLGILLALDASNRAWDHTHPIRWFFRDFGAILGSGIAATAAFFTIKAMRDQIRSTEKLENEKLLVANIEAVRTRAEELSLRWGQIMFRGRHYADSFRNYLEPGSISDEGTDGKNDREWFVHFHSQDTPIPNLELFAAGHLPAQMRRTLTTTHQLIESYRSDVNSPERMFERLAQNFAETLRQWEKSELVFLANVLFLEKYAEQLEAGEPPKLHPGVDRHDAERLSEKLNLERTVPALLRKHQVESDPEIRNWMARTVPER